MSLKSLRASACLLLLCLVLPSIAIRRNPPPYLVSTSAYNATLASLQLHVKSVAALPGFRRVGTPLFFLHPPGTRVYGTVLLYHGFGGSAFSSRLQARQLFDQKLNVVALNLAGFAQNITFWVSTVLRENAGLSKVRAAIEDDPELSALLRDVNNGRTEAEQNAVFARFGKPLMPLVFAALRQRLAPEDFAIATRALNLLRPVPQHSNFQRDIRRYFVSGHQRFEADPLEKLRLVQALPGPVHVISFSLGASAALNLAARSRVIDRVVMLAPFLSRFRSPEQVDLTHFFVAMGSINLISQSRGVPGGFISLPARYLTAATIAAELINRDEITNAVRESTKTYCFMAEDDTVIDVNHALEVCRSKIAGRAFIYPRRLGIGHRVPPESGNQYSDALMEQAANFFINGRVDKGKLLTRN